MIELLTALITILVIGLNCESGLCFKRTFNDMRNGLVLVITNLTGAHLQVV